MLGPAAKKAKSQLTDEQAPGPKAAAGSNLLTPATRVASLARSWPARRVWRSRPH